MFSAWKHGYALGVPNTCIQSAQVQGVLTNGAQHVYCQQRILIESECSLKNEQCLLRQWESQLLGSNSRQVSEFEANLSAERIPGHSEMHREPTSNEKNRQAKNRYSPLQRLFQIQSPISDQALQHTTYYKLFSLSFSFLFTDLSELLTLYSPL